MTPVKITTEYITLGQFLKFVNIASGGGDIKAVLASTKITVNDDLENRRGKKLYPGDTIIIADEGVFTITK